MLLMKLKTVGAVLFVILGVVALGDGLFTRQTEAAQSDGEKSASSTADQPRGASPPRETPKTGTLSLLEKILEVLTPPAPPKPADVPPAIVTPLDVPPPPVPPLPAGKGIPKVVDRSVEQPKPADLSAKQIVERMAKAYTDCKSYRDSGIVKTLFVEKSGNRTVEKPFTTAFVRHDRFRFEYKEKWLSATGRCALSSRPTPRRSELGGT